VERMCALAGVSRTGYYRHWEASRPRQAETVLRDRIQRLALDHRHYGYGRLTASLKREGWPVNHKRVLRIARGDNLLCLRRRRFVLATTQSDHAKSVAPRSPIGPLSRAIPRELRWVAPPVGFPATTDGRQLWPRYTQARTRTSASDPPT
jgi:putative transposase